MAIWIQSLSWTLICSLAQGLMVCTSLWLVFKLIPTISANIRYHLSLSALTILLGWFAATWWQQFHSLTLASERSLILHTPHTATLQQFALANEYAGGYPSILSSVQVIFPWLSAFYFIGLALMLVRLSSGILQLFSLKKTGISQPDTNVSELLASLKKKINFDRHVQLFISVKAPIPMIIGFLKPVILVPVATMAQLSTEQLETILLHELLHIKRYDYLVNILQTVVETVLFFNPFVWMVSAITRREREHSCDDMVLEHTGEPLSYATALAALATYPATTSSFTVAATGTPNYLFHRIKRIMEMKKNPFSYSRMAAAILIIAAITCSIAWVTPSFARHNDDKTADTNTKQEQSDESLLINRLLADHLIDQVKGFVVEKQQNILYIDGQAQSAEIANKYLQSLKQEYIRVKVYSFIERMKKHPDASFLQILLPVTESSGCIDYSTKKPGC